MFDCKYKPLIGRKKCFWREYLFKTACKLQLQFNELQEAFNSVFKQ